MFSQYTVSKHCLQALSQTLSPKLCRQSSALEIASQISLLPGLGVHTSKPLGSPGRQLDVPNRVRLEALYAQPGGRIESVTRRVSFLKFVMIFSFYNYRQVVFIGPTA
jgi:hypothetical protein